MPRYYGDRMDIVIEEGKTLDEAMLIKNSSLNSELADFGNYASQEDIDYVVSLSNSEDEVE